MTDAEAIARWHDKVAGAIALGTDRVRASLKARPEDWLTEEFGRIMREIGATADRLIIALKADFTRKEPHESNGRSPNEAGSRTGAGRTP